MKKLLLISMFLMVLFYTCKKDKEIPSPVINDPEALSQEEVLILDNSEEATGFDPSTIILPNGENLDDYLMEFDPSFYNDLKSASSDPYANLGPQDARNLLIAKISYIAYNLTNRSKYQIPSGTKDEPAQNGLAYSWGSKDYTIRQKPPGAGTKCNYKIYGLDCSGFIHQIFKRAGVNMIIGPADSQKNPTTLENKIKTSIPSLTKIKVENLGAIPISEFESGDIVYWLKPNGIAEHIGIILKNASGLAVFQSNGVPGKNNSECENNLSLKRGPRTFNINDSYWFGPTRDYGITRMNAILSGSWTLFLKCSNETTDAILFNLNFPTTSSNSFEINGTGTDYDGTPVHCKASMTYNNAQNILSGKLHMTKPDAPDFYRNDSFTVKLEKDETDYFSLVLEDGNEVGCDLKGRLVNNENKKAASLISFTKREIITGGETVNEKMKN